MKQRQKIAPKMVEGLFAGYKMHTDGKWRGEYLVYDRTFYENWNGNIDIPVHVTKELYLPGDAADSRDKNEFQFPVRDGDWRSKAPSLNRYIQRRYSKRGAKPDSRNQSKPKVVGGPAALDYDKAETSCESTAEDPNVERDMFEDMLSKVRGKLDTMNAGQSATAGSGATDATADTDASPVDVWVRRGEYIVRRHLKPRDSLFSPTQWLYESGNKAIPIYDNDGHFTFMDLNCLEAWRGTVTDSSYLGEHWGTW